MNPSIPSCLLLACRNTVGFCCSTLRSTALLSLFVAVAFWKAPPDFPQGWAHCQGAEFRWPFPNVMAWILPSCLITLTGRFHGKQQGKTSFSFFSFRFPTVLGENRSGASYSVSQVSGGFSLSDWKGFLFFMVWGKFVLKNMNGYWNIQSFSVPMKRIIHLPRSFQSVNMYIFFICLHTESIL